MRRPEFMDEDSTLINEKRLIYGARFRAVPLNVKCPARCAFCYETQVSKVLPHVRTRYLPPYDEESFDAFRQMHARACEWEAESGREPVFGFLPTFEHTPQGIAHFPWCDVFSTGLTSEQIEELVRIREGDTCLLYTVGLNIDPEFIAYLTRKYPETFRLHLSIVTFDPTIRRRLMHKDIDVDALRRVSAIARDATFFFLLFDDEQITADVKEILTTTTAENGGLFIHKLYHDRCSPSRVVEYARRADSCREKAIRALARLPRDERPFMCSLGGDIQAHTRRFEIYEILEDCSGDDDEVVFCSPAAYPTIADFFSDVESTVIPMESAFGGDLDFVQAGSARIVIERIAELLAAGKTLRRVFLPDAMFWIDDGYDLNGDRVELVSTTFPDLSVELLKIPTEVIRSVVSLEDCVAFYDDKGRS